MDTTKSLFQYFLQSSGVSIDSRQEMNGKIFFAIRGENFDGNKFASQAVEKGALLAVVDRPELANKTSCFYVEDSLKALQALATHFRIFLDIPTLAITGSNGKTTSKELISAVLSKKFKLHATPGNFNNHIGVPLTILSCPRDTEFLITEMGANHLKEIAQLCEIARPNYGTITNIGKAHLEGFGSYKNILKGKTELYRYLDANDGLIIINGQDDLLTTELSKLSKVFMYSDRGKLPDGSSYAMRLESIDPMVSFNLKKDDEEVVIQSNLLGAFNYLNLKLACAIGLYFHVSLHDIKAALEAYKPKNNRTEIRRIGSNTFVLDAYNANPSSMALSLESFKELGSDRIVILGDMKELGTFSLAEHKQIIQLLLKENWKEIYLVGDEFKKAVGNSGLNWYPSVKELKQDLDLGKYENTHFLLKGSRSMKLESLLE